MSDSPPPIDKSNNNDSDDLFYSTMGESNINLNDNDVNCCFFYIK